MIIDDYYFMIIDDWLLLWLLKKIVIANFSSSINEVIRSVCFFLCKISQVQKSTKKHQKALKSTKKH